MKPDLNVLASIKNSNSSIVESNKYSLIRENSYIISCKSSQNRKE